MRRHQLTAAKGAAKTVKPISAVTPGAKAARSCSPACSTFASSISAGQRHNHQAGQAFLVTHRKLILGSGTLAIAAR
jgi:hypothetical protein